MNDLMLMKYFCGRKLNKFSAQYYCSTAGKIGIKYIKYCYPSRKFKMKLNGKIFNLKFK